ncbi:putative acetyltransferase [Nostocoides japonicum T1-X7]|uniref:Putative acetyltransferase n=1 Tax=Nostocoides japonicum T1-X7 TaxID=1194083 RepID=A0A077LZH2_9MICO|nr:GNAT family N-acetyltransferase [Tetrasphaera japonica]CCH79353.1 putative acetyltransferase [Tetrasphaera japonica T1-X7]
MRHPSARGARRARAADLDALVALRAEMFDAMRVPATDDTWRRAARSWFAERLDDPGACLAVVEVEGEVVSSALGVVRDSAPSPANPAGRDVLVFNVCTLPHARGHGHARAALATVMEWARGTGAGRAELFATPAGRALYEEAGFVVRTDPAMRADLRARADPEPPAELGPPADPRPRAEPTT